MGSCSPDEICSDESELAHAIVRRADACHLYIKLESRFQNFKKIIDKMIIHILPTLTLGFTLSAMNERCITQHKKDPCLTVIGNFESLQVSKEGISHQTLVNLAFDL